MNRPKRTATIRAEEERMARKVVTTSNRNTLREFKQKLNQGLKLSKYEQAEQTELLQKLANAGENTSPYAKIATKREPTVPGQPRVKKMKMVSDANVAKSYYLLSIAMGNVSGIPVDPNQKARLVNAARKFRLATKHQLASWAGSFLETAGFNTGAKRNQGVEVEDGKQKDKPNGGVSYGNPKWLIYKNGNSSRPRTAPTIFLKTAWDMDLIKGSNAVAKSRRVMPANLAKNMTNLVAFTETLINTPNDTAGNSNEVLAGKTKGTTQIQPDIILTIPAKHEIHIYELKIGAGKKETIPAEAIQLAKMKYILDVHLADEAPKWKVIPHFLPWRFGQMNTTSLNFKNWETTQLKGVKKIADALVAWAAANPDERGSYRIIRSTKNNTPLRNYLNVPTVNRVLNLSHIGRIGNAASGARTVAVESFKRQISNQMNAAGINGVKAYLLLAGKNARIPSRVNIQRALLDDLEKQSAFYFANITNQSLIPQYFITRRLSNPRNSAVSEVSGYARGAPGSISRDVLKARLARSASIADAFVSATRAISQNPDPELVGLVDNVKKLLETGGIAFSNTNYNATTRNILNAVRANRELQANRVYAKFVNKFGNSAKNLASKAILQTLTANQSLTNNTRTRAQFLLENFNAGINAARARALRVPTNRRA